jgi:hypothetical protein
MVKKLFLRPSGPKDADAVIDFYADNPHQYVYQRAADVLRERVESGAVMMIVDEDDKIMATAISYPLITKDAAGSDVHDWSEIGSVRVALGETGLFKPLVSALVLNSWLFEPPGDRFVIEIAKNNAHSRHVFAKEGATPFNIPPELEKKVAGTLEPGTTQMSVDWFQFGPEAMPGFAANLLSIEENPSLVNKKTGEEFVFDVSGCALFSRFHDILEKLSHMDYGDAAQPDFSRKLRHLKP